MNTYTYTKRELSIIRRKKPLSISNEEFLAIYHKAYYRERIQTLQHMCDLYPEIAEEVSSSAYQAKRHDPADQEHRYRYPIVINTTRFTQARIMNMVAYLHGQMNAPVAYINLLHTQVPYREVFNFITEEYVKDYLTVPLWENYFLGVDNLRHAVQHRSINSLGELVARASEFFERLVPETCIKYGICQNTEWR